MVIWRRENIHQHVNGTAPKSDLIYCPVLVDRYNFDFKYNNSMINFRTWLPELVEKKGNLVHSHNPYYVAF